MSKSAVGLMMAALLVVPSGLMAMSHEKHDMHKGHDMHGEKMNHSDGHKMDHGKMDHKGMGHDGMEMHGDMVMLGSEVKKGVKARVHIKDVSEAMAKMNMEQTHHLMVSFVKDNNGAEGMAIEKGTVAVKVESPSGAKSDPIEMIGMEGHFGADLALKEKGMYHFKIGTKLEDGVKRQYHFHTELK